MKIIDLLEKWLARLAERSKGLARARAEEVPGVLYPESGTGADEVEDWYRNQLASKNMSLVSRETGINQASLSRYKSGKSGLSPANLEKLQEYLEALPRSGAGRKRPRKAQANRKPARGKS